MSRPRKPTAILRLTGTEVKNPSRLRARENEPQDLPELGDPPKRLNDKQLEAWREIVANSAYGVLTGSDRHSLEIAAVLLAAFWRDGASMSAANISLLNSSLSKMGMNPSDRSRVTVQQPKAVNPFARFND